MRILILLSTVLLFSSCSQNQLVTASQIPEVTSSPSWVTNRPVSSLDYIGIGRANKTGSIEEYTAIARKNALNDMASEIQVNVSSNSLLYTLEHDERFSANFSEQIQTRTDLDLEGFEAYDVYQSATEYWVYYRLDKAKYEALKKERQKKAIERAFNDLNLAHNARQAGNVGLAAEYYVKSIADLKPYWGEDNEYNLSQKGMPVDKSALTELMDMRNNFKLKSDYEHIHLNIENGFEETVIIRALIDGRNGEAIPFTHRQGKAESASRTGDLIKLKIEPGEEVREVLLVEADPFQAVREALKDPALAFLKSLLTKEVFQADIHVEYPSMSLVVLQEWPDGSTSPADALRAAFMKQLSIEHIATDASSPFRIEIYAKSKDAGMSQGFQVVYTDVSIKGVDQQTDKVYFLKEIPAVKGVHSDLASAADKSIQKAAGLIDHKLLKALLDAMF